MLSRLLYTAAGQLARAAAAVAPAGDGKLAGRRVEQAAQHLSASAPGRPELRPMEPRQGVLPAAGAEAAAESAASIASRKLAMGAAPSTLRSPMRKVGVDRAPPLPARS